MGNNKKEPKCQTIHKDLRPIKTLHEERSLYTLGGMKLRVSMKERTITDAVQIKYEVLTSRIEISGASGPLESN